MNTTTTAPSKTNVAPAQPRTSSRPKGFHSVTPHLVCSGAAAALEFYKKAFGAVEITRLSAGDSDKLMHASMTIGDSIVMLVDEFPEWGSSSPTSLKGSSVSIHLYVDDVDAAFARAVAAGATAKMPVMDMFWGDRYGMVSDPFGHNWSIATHLRDLTPEQLKAAAEEACAQPHCSEAAQQKH